MYKRQEQGAKGILHASQISTGEENDLNIRVYGEKAGLAWRQMEPNSLVVTWLDKPKEILRTGFTSNLYKEAIAHTRVPGGHPEGYMEAFANIYRNFAICLRAHLAGTTPDPIYQDFPTVQDGVRGMQFVNRVVESSATEQKWLPF